MVRKQVHCPFPQHHPNQNCRQTSLCPRYLFKVFLFPFLEQLLTFIQYRSCGRYFTTIIWRHTRSRNISYSIYTGILCTQLFFLFSTHMAINQAVEFFFYALAYAGVMIYLSPKIGPAVMVAFLLSIFIPQFLLRRSIKASNKRQYVNGTFLSAVQVPAFTLLRPPPQPSPNHL